MSLLIQPLIRTQSADQIGENAEKSACIQENVHKFPSEQVSKCSEVSICVKFSLIYRTVFLSEI